MEQELTLTDDDVVVDDVVDDVCRECGGRNDDGEGFDGLCGSCADRAYPDAETVAEALRCFPGGFELNENRADPFSEFYDESVAA
jgi:hypothetical protein